MSEPDAFPLLGIYNSEYQAVGRYDVPETVDENMTEYLTAGYLEKIYDQPDVKMVDPDAEQAVRVTDRGENALLTTLEEHDLKHLLEEE